VLGPQNRDKIAERLGSLKSLKKNPLSPTAKISEKEVGRNKGLWLGVLDRMGFKAKVHDVNINGKRTAEPTEKKKNITQNQWKTSR